MVPQRVERATTLASGGGQAQGQPEAAAQDDAEVDVVEDESGRGGRGGEGAGRMGASLRKEKRALSRVKNIVEHFELVLFNGGPGSTLPAARAVPCFAWWGDHGGSG